MNLISHEFFLIFVPQALAVYYWLARTPRLKMFVLLAVSFYFYSLAGWKFVPVLFGLSLATYFLARWQRFGWGIWLNLAALFLFKYWNFGIENINQVSSLFHVRLSLLNLGLPLGLSFFIFKHVGYLLDVQQKRYPPASDFWSFATFSAYFPQISAGPISNYKETAEQFESLPRKLNAEQTASALTYISVGLAKKILIADTLNALLMSPDSQSALFSGMIPAWYLATVYTARLYFDFSGYTDLMLGVSQLFGIRLPQNFNNPFLASNPAEFWERWHMSLSGWFRLYLFSPVSRFFLRKWGSAKREWAQYAANLATMTLIGLWHGAGWNYILWGAYHGVGLNFSLAWKRVNLRIHPLVERIIFLIFILIGSTIFMVENGSTLFQLIANMFGMSGLGTRAAIIELLKTDATLALIFALPIAFSGAAEATNLVDRIKEKKSAALALGVVAALCIMLIEKTASAFIYIQF